MSPLRIWFIVLYIICLTPFLNIVFIGALELLVIPIVQLIFFPQSQRKINLGSFIVLTLLVQVYFILTTELTIRTNRPLLVDSAQEGDWTFGQTLAVSLVAIPLIDVVMQSWKECKTVLDILKRLWSRVIRPGRLLFQRRGEHYRVVLSMVYSLILNPRSKSSPRDDLTCLALISIRFIVTNLILDIHLRPPFCYTFKFSVPSRTSLLLPVVLDLFAEFVVNLKPNIDSNFRSENDI